ncbi:MAG TPA: hypothetical protein VIV12_27265, partial [Streptosporangiaceae bacterium]
MTFSSYGAECRGIVQYYLLAGNRGRGSKLPGQLRGTGLLATARSQIAAKVGEPQRVSMVVEAALLLVEDREAAPRVSVRGEGAGGGVVHAPGVPGAPPLGEIHAHQCLLVMSAPAVGENPRAW